MKSSRPRRQHVPSTDVVVFDQSCLVRSHPSQTFLIFFFQTLGGMLQLRSDSRFIRLFGDSVKLQVGQSKSEPKISSMVRGGTRINSLALTLLTDLRDYVLDEQRVVPYKHFETFVAVDLTSQVFTNIGFWGSDRNLEAAH